MRVGKGQECALPLRQLGFGRLSVLRRPRPVWREGRSALWKRRRTVTPLKCRVNSVWDEAVGRAAVTAAVLSVAVDSLAALLSW